MTTDLETERATGRDLSAQAVKLRGMLKTGQDALRQEQELVAQLQKQLQNHLVSLRLKSPTSSVGFGRWQRTLVASSC